jgi:hypothetical protein
MEEMIMDKQTQESRILAALKAGQWLTPRSAVAKFDCFRLGARIYDLRRKGYVIQVDRALGKARYAIYYMRAKDRKRK